MSPRQVLLYTNVLIAVLHSGSGASAESQFPDLAIE
jgi:hypothetical protein